MTTIIITSSGNKQYLKKIINKMIKQRCSDKLLRLL